MSRRGDDGHPARDRGPAARRNQSVAARRAAQAGDARGPRRCHQEGEQERRPAGHRALREVDERVRLRLEARLLLGFLLLVCDAL